MNKQAELIKEALKSKGYRCLREEELSLDPATKFNNRMTWWGRTPSGVMLILHDYTHGCELYMPIVTSNSIQETIDAIPS